MTETTITKEQLAVIRKAATNSKYGVRYYIVARYTVGAEPAGVVTIGEEIDLGEGTEPRYVTKRLDIPALGSVERYGGGESEVYVASAQHYMTSSRSPLRTLASLLKVGDTLRVAFLIGNNTETLSKAELAHDEAYIIVQRGNKVIGDVLVDDVVAPVYSLARMGGRS